MKTLTAVVIVSAVASLSFAPAVLAQTDRTQAPARTSVEKREVFKAPDGVAESSKLIGTKIKSSAGKDLGEIDQVLIDTKTGKITHAVIGTGGVLGVAETKIVVPWSAVNLAADASNRDRMVVTMEQSALDTAPRYDRQAAGTDRAPATPSASPKTEDKRPAPSR